MPAPTDDCRSCWVSFDSLRYYSAMLYDYDRFQRWLSANSIAKIDRKPNQWRDVDFVSPRRQNEKSPRSSAFYTLRTGGSRGHQVHTECICTWLSIGFYWMTIFAIEMNRKNRPSREFRPFPQKWLALWLCIQIPKARASAKFQFRCFPLVSYRHFWRIFAKIAKINYFSTFG